MNPFFIILILGALNTITPFSIDLYLPAFPVIARDLQASTSAVSLTLSSYFLGYSIGQILYGPLLDRFGRKKPIAVGLAIYILATFGCGLSQTVSALILLRFIQALGGSAASVAATAMVRDFFPPEKSAKVFSLMTLILGISPLLAPTVGGILVTHFGWQAVFLLLAAMVSCITLFTLYFLPEGHTPDPSVSLAPQIILRDFYQILCNRDFLTYSIAGSFSFSGLFVYVAGSPAIFMDGFKVSAQVYGAIFAFLAVGMLSGSQLNLWLGKRASSQSIFKNTLILQVIVGTAFLFSVILGVANLPLTLVFLFLLLTCAGITYPNAAAISLAPFSENAGRASALLGFLQLGLGSLICSGVGVSDYKGSLPTAFVMATSSIVGLLLLMGLKSRRFHTPI